MPVFGKIERLCGKAEFEKLFKQGKGFLIHPLRVQYLMVELVDEPCKMVVSVSKKITKKAHERNRIKRQVKEAYRIDKEPFRELLMQRNKAIHLAFIYIGKSKTDFALIQEKIKLILARLSKDCD